MNIQFRTADVTISEGVVTAVFSDGKENEFNTHWVDSPEYREIARDHGFGEDWRFYAYTHELTHHWLADRLGWKWSWSVHDNTDYPDGTEWPDHIAWEEHIVNKLQRYTRTGQHDEFGVLRAVFGELDLYHARYELAELYKKVFDI